MPDWTYAPAPESRETARLRESYGMYVDGEFTAQAFITTDLDDNQINAFHPGAMDHSHRNRVPLDAGVTLGVIADNLINMATVLGRRAAA